MAAWFVIFSLFCVNYTVGYSIIEDAEREGPKWPTEFHIQAEKIDLESGIVEAMELWSNAAINRSRMDYYGGLVKKYYDWDSFVYKFIPESTDEYQNKIKCLIDFPDSDDTNDFLPNVENYNFTGERELDGIQVEVWRYEMVEDNQTWLERTLYTYPSGDFDVPVRFEARNFLNVKGAMTAHTIINYYGYEPKVAEEDLVVENDDCDMARLGEDFNSDVKYLHPARETDVHVAFRRYKKHHSKSYDSEGEHELRKAIFRKNWEMVLNHNRQNHGYKLELNRFADLTPDEMQRFTGLLPGPSIAGTHLFPHSDEEVKILAEKLPENYDLRLEGFISPIKDQASCGSCWAFSSTAAVEGAVARRNGGRIVDLSEQSLVDCAWGYGCEGCGGGVMDLAFRYILKNGIPMEHEYGTYLEQDGLCHKGNMTTTVRIQGFAKPTAYNPEALKVALYKYGPVAVSIHFSDKMRFYSSGIFYDPTCNLGRQDHGVVVVGYGTRNGTDYWILRNSHGAAWGQAGYMLISAADNNCFVLSNPVYPVV